MEGEESLRRFSPELMIQDPNVANAASLLPPVVLFHGTGDYSIPSDARFGSLIEEIFSYLITKMKKNSKDWPMRFCMVIIVLNLNKSFLIMWLFLAILRDDCILFWIICFRSINLLWR